MLSVYDGSAAPASLAYQFGLGGINNFREQGGELATSVGLVTQLSLNESLNLPLGASIATRYQRINTRNWTRRIRTEPRTSSTAPRSCSPTSRCGGPAKPAGLEWLISSMGANARVLETRQLNGTQPLLGEVLNDRGMLRVRSFPLSGTIVFAGERPVSSTVGYSLSKRLDAKPGLSSNGDNSDFSIDVVEAMEAARRLEPAQ